MGADLDTTPAPTPEERAPGGIWPAVGAGDALRLELCRTMELLAKLDELDRRLAHFGGTLAQEEDPMSAEDSFGGTRPEVLDLLSRPSCPARDSRGLPAQYGGGGRPRGAGGGSIGGAG